MPARTPDHTAAPARGLSARLHTGLCRGEEDADVRGYRLTEAASAGTFVEVAYLLLHARLPDQDRLADFRTLLACAAEVPPVIRALTEELPLHVTPRPDVAHGGQFIGRVRRPGRPDRAGGATDPGRRPDGPAAAGVRRHPVL